MTLGLTTSPSYPVAGREVTLTITGATGDLISVRCSAAPSDSKLAKAIEAAKLNVDDTPRVFVDEFLVTEGWEYTFDKGGAYTLLLQEYTFGASAYGGGYYQDPNSYPTRTKVAAAATGDEIVVVYIGQKMTATLRNNVGDSVDLTLFVHDDTIRETTVATHGFFSPVFNNPVKRGKLALSAGAINTKLAALVDQTVSSAFDVDSYVTDAVDALSSHYTRTASSTHANADSSNNLGLAAAPTTYGNIESLTLVAKAMLRSYSNHVLDQTYEGSEQVDATYSSIGIHTIPTYDNGPVAPIPVESDPMTSFLTIADVGRLYELHRVDVSAHGASDTTNTIATAKPKIIDLCAEFLRLVRGVAAAPPEGDSEGAVLLESYGFRRA